MEMENLSSQNKILFAIQKHINFHQTVKSRKSVKLRIFCFLLACIGKVREITSLIFDINGAIRVNYNIKQVLI